MRYLLGIFGETSGQKNISNPSADIVAFAHMVNNKEAVQMAMSEGVNGVEIDLQFTENGNPKEFRHGGICDCSCKCLLGGNWCPDDDVCNALWKKSGSHCNAKEEATALISFLATFSKQLAVIYIDSKVDNGATNLTEAGKQVIKLLDKYAFAKGFKGQVIIGTPFVKQIAYAKAAVQAAKASPNKSKYYFAIDGEGHDFEKAMNNKTGLLSLDTKNRAYSVGITVCSPETFSKEILLSAANQKKGVLCSTGIWTLDKQSSMETYLDYGANALMSNKPAVLLAAIKAKDGILATPGFALKPATSDDLILSF